MKKIIVSIFVGLVTSISISAQTSDSTRDLPELNTIKTVTLAPSYSCRDETEFQKGYAATALFLTDTSKKQNDPELVFNGACRAEDYFVASTAGDDMSLIADLGENIPLEQLSAQKIFNLKMVQSVDAYSKFALNFKVQLNHTYAVLINETSKRGLFVFTVVNYVPNQKVELRYAVKSYQIIQASRAAEGFKWDKENN